MARSKKPYPGMGAWVVLLEYPGAWVVYRGAATEDAAKKARRELPQWPDHKVRIVPNVAPDHSS